MAMRLFLAIGGAATARGALTSTGPCQQNGMHPLYCEKGDDTWKSVTMESGMVETTMYHPADAKLEIGFEGDAPLCDCGDHDGEVGHTDHGHADDTKPHEGGGHAGDTKPATPEMSLGSCTYMEYAFPTVICAVAQEDCNMDTGDDGGTWHAPGHVTEKGCCHCSANCDKSLETAEACTYYDPPATGGDSDEGTPATTSQGSCYDRSSHGITCDMSEADCDTQAGVWYAPAFVGTSGCCHCKAGCDHTKETAEDCGAAWADHTDHTGHDHGGHGGDKEDEDHMDHGDKEDEHSGHGDKEDGHGDHGHGGHGEGDCGATGDYSNPLGPCAQGDTYPLFCTAVAADAASSVNGHHMMQGLFMPNVVEPMCHGNYVGDAVACACPAVNEDGEPCDPGNGWVSYGDAEAGDGSEDPLPPCDAGKENEDGDESDGAASRGLVAAAATLFLATLA